jgi:hypothetical protein
VPSRPATRSLGRSVAHWSPPHCRVGSLQHCWRTQHTAPKAMNITYMSFAVSDTNDTWSRWVLRWWIAGHVRG